MEKKKISDCAIQIRGVSYKPTDLHKTCDNDSVILLRANNIKGGKINFDDTLYVDKSCVSAEQYLQRGDILICASSGIKELVGKAAQIDFDAPCTFGAFCKAVRPIPAAASILGVYFQSPTYRRRISFLSQGANINNIRNEHIGNLEIPAYSKETQHKIISKIHSITASMDDCRHLLAKLDMLVKSRFIEMFGDKDYPTKPIGDVVDRNIGRVGKTFKADDVIRYIDISSVDNKTSHITGCTDYVVENAPSRAQYVLRKDDILYSTVRPNLKNMAINPYNDDNIVGSTGFCVLRCKNVATRYLWGILTSDRFTHEMVKKATGANYPAVSDKTVLSYEIAVPPMDLQNQYEQFVALADKSKLTLQRLIGKQELLRSKLMQEYFG